MALPSKFSITDTCYKSVRVLFRLGKDENVTRIQDTKNKCCELDTWSNKPLRKGKKEKKGGFKKVKSMRIVTKKAHTNTIDHPVNGLAVCCYKTCS